MPEQRRRFDAAINELGDYLRVAFTRDGPTVTHFAVEYVALIEGQERPVLRCDTAHGFAHYDILDWDGRTVRWARAPDLTYNEALTAAIADMQANWERYRMDFLRRRP